MFFSFFFLFFYENKFFIPNSINKKNPYYYNMVCGLDKYIDPAPKSKYIIYIDDAEKINSEPHSPCTLEIVLA